MKYTRRQAILTAGAGVAGLGGAAWLATRPGDAPRGRFVARSGKKLNVLFVLADQERAWDLYPAGFFEKHTPARKWLRDNGVHFTRFQTPNAFCSPARGIIASGAQSPNNGIWDNAPILYSTPLRIDRPTIGSLFQDAGYITGYSGKWHLSRMPEERETNAADRAEINRTIKSYGFTETDVREETDGPLGGSEHDARTVDRAIAFIKRRENDEKPWFLSVNLLNPHDVMYYTSGDEMTRTRVSEFPDKSVRPPFEDPIYAQDLGYEVTDNFGPRTFGDRPAGVREYHLTFSEAMGYFPYNDPVAAREMQNYYWNCTRDCDRELQRLLDALNASGELENTVIVFTSDHGEVLGTHGVRGKGTGLFREQNHVPAIVVHPHGPKGAEVATPHSHVDWIPTLLSMAGVSETQLKDQMPMVVGRDFSAQIFDPKAGSTRDRDGVLLLWTSVAYQNHKGVRRFDEIRRMPAVQRPFAMHELMQDGIGNRGQMRAIYDGRYKFARYSSPVTLGRPTNLSILRAGYDLELYDTHADPSELRNLAAQPHAVAPKLVEMNARLNRLVEMEIGRDEGGFLPWYMTV